MLIALIITQAALYWMAIWVSITIAGFFVMGLVVRSVVARALPPDEEESMPGMDRTFEEAPEDETEEESSSAAETPADDDGYNDYLNDPVEDAFMDDR
jgi:flagellar biosynthesis/type III secretory pathway M-ring protein FliF/YscJ